MIQRNQIKQMIKAFYEQLQLERRPNFPAQIMYMLYLVIFTLKVSNKLCCDYFKLNYSFDSFKIDHKNNFY